VCAPARFGTLVIILLDLSSSLACSFPQHARLCVPARICSNALCLAFQLFTASRGRAGAGHYLKFGGVIRLARWVFETQERKKEGVRKCLVLSSRSRKEMGVPPMSFYIILTLAGHWSGAHCQLPQKVMRIDKFLSSVVSRNIVALGGKKSGGVGASEITPLD
jgi:hypothetical protein